MTFRDKYYRYGYLALTNKNDSERIKKALVEEYDCKVLGKSKIFKRFFRDLTCPEYLHKYIQDEIVFKAPNTIVTCQAIEDLSERVSGRWCTFDPIGYLGD